jgi:hypothetical protein
MNIYHCHYQYKRGQNIYTETHYLLGQTPEECRSLLCQVLRIPRLEYFTQTHLCSVSGISQEIVDKISHQNYDRITEIRNQPKRDTLRFPTDSERRQIEQTKERLEPKPFISKVKEQIVEKYR